jgi:hypothetical protein
MRGSVTRIIVSYNANLVFVLVSIERIMMCLAIDTSACCEIRSVHAKNMSANYISKYSLLLRFSDKNDEAFLIYTSLLQAPPVLSNSFNSPNNILLADSLELSPS